MGAIHHTRCGELLHSVDPACPWRANNKAKRVLMDQSAVMRVSFRPLRGKARCTVGPLGWSLLVSDDFFLCCYLLLYFKLPFSQYFLHKVLHCSFLALLLNFIINFTQPKQPQAPTVPLVISPLNTHPARLSALLHAHTTLPLLRRRYRARRSLP